MAEDWDLYAVVRSCTRPPPIPVDMPPLKAAAATTTTIKIAWPTSSSSPSKAARTVHNHRRWGWLPVDLQPPLLFHFRRLWESTAAAKTTVAGGSTTSSTTGSDTKIKKEIICYRILGHGVNTDRNPSKALRIQGTTTGAVARKGVRRGNNWSVAIRIPTSLSLPTPANTRTPSRLTGTLSPEVLGQGFNCSKCRCHHHTASCSSPQSATSLSPISPTTPLSAPEDATVAVQNAGEDERVGMALESESDEYDDDLLIPNVHVDEDLFEGLGELVGSAGSGVGRSLIFGDNFSSWSTDNSTATGAASSGGY
ncbi:hypothetical protein F3Y22_tig00000002pilonHSYRG00231 [Hibiscus syriacus]|uniref:Uncharacterized protein n=1 Tax=Hibiscus syriacus TaxID=106335 RepID=A0A6A3D7B0_HIBSY|nr:hypothetical protein F3Y22_tig00000002pilonHSYRG00231 [Hibiscus syriacus]